MGTLLITGLVIGLFAAFIELRIGLGTFMREIIAKSAMLGIVFSIALSVLLGSIFGAAGVTVMIIAVVCMTITQPIYMIYNRIRATGREIADVTNDVKKAVSPFWSMFKFAFKVMIFPFWLIWKILSFFQSIGKPEQAKATA